MSGGNHIVRDSLPSSSAGAETTPACGLEGRLVAERLNETASRGLWTYVAAMKAARGDDADNAAVIHGWFNKVGAIELQRDDNPKWRMAVQVCDSTGFLKAFLKPDVIEELVGASVGEYAASSEDAQKVMFTACAARLGKYCGRIKLMQTEGKTFKIMKLDPQPTKFAQIVVKALKERVEAARKR